MHICLKRLTLTCRQPCDAVDFDNRVVLISGPVTVGKTTTLNLIDYCFGGSYDGSWGPAIRNEITAVRLDALIGTNSVVLERAIGSNRVEVTWADSTGSAQFLSVPTDAGDTELITNVFGLSDLLFVLSGVEPVKVPKRAADPDSELIRLSFRDLLWFCYLHQERLDSNFFNLYDQNRRAKARWAMRFFTGFYSERLSLLEQRQEELRLKRASVNAASEQLSEALTEVSDGATTEELKIRRSSLEAALATSENFLKSVSEEFHSATHAVDELREELRGLFREISEREVAIDSLAARTAELSSLRAEYLALRLRADRSRVALTIIGDAAFEHCPQCARGIQAPETPGLCPLCKSSEEEVQPFNVDALQAASDDLTQRIIEIEDALRRHEASLTRQRHLAVVDKTRKQQLDDDLQQALREYDSAYVSRLREGERRVSRAREALSTTNNLLRLHDNLQRYEATVAELTSELQRTRAAISAEMRAMTRAQEIVAALEREFLTILRRVGVPGVGPEDRIRIDPMNWIPWVLNDSKPDDAWDYIQASSGGRRVLFVGCFALALHIVAEKFDLPVPSLLMIDTPIKNVERDINKELVQSMQRALFESAESDLQTTQMILANGTFEQYQFLAEPIRIHFTRERGLISYYSEDSVTPKQQLTQAAAKVEQLTTELRARAERSGHVVQNLPAFGPDLLIDGRIMIEVKGSGDTGQVIRRAREGVTQLERAEYAGYQAVLAIVGETRPAIIANDEMALLWSPNGNQIFGNRRADEVCSYLIDDVVQF